MVFVLTCDYKMIAISTKHIVASCLQYVTAYVLHNLITLLSRIDVFMNVLMRKGIFFYQWMTILFEKSENDP